METAENLKELTLMIEAQDQVCGVCFPKKKRSRAGAEPPNPSTPPPARKQFVMGARWEEMPMEETRPLTFRILSRASVGSRGCSCLGVGGQCQTGKDSLGCRSSHPIQGSSHSSHSVISQFHAPLGIQRGPPCAWAVELVMGTFE